ncbi:hypothetical protein GS16_02420 [Candidatus Liberibacter solanacearum]|uniref:Primosomal protein I n=1 Tax=Candidatus Liberibacter solanacearum TaxID=556287 RepID=A0A095A0Q5_9HYPH|nr:YdaU family protein [Candidatus Liberibacter solanacearum]KGB27681.1 hypothetical protein GS16_02420 [Candidatus Liberibacter solanacearum]KJZ81187.1 hypothetical protein KP07_01445 [Candidatus Liberibacter solanacearum]KJZ81643.1 Primosomal protein I [Candidatus Liberibacter solanacearum]KQC48920.1 hypothetical protein AP064_03835 [Candidatus Liberibacter solanacearum]
MNNRPWYKRYPADFISGVLELTLEQKGAYSIIIDLMYDRGGAVPDNDKYIAGVCGCSIRKWRSIRIVLEKANKIFSKGGNIYNYRVEKEMIKAMKAIEERQENGRKGGIKSSQMRTLTHKNNNLFQGILESAHASYKPEAINKKTSNHFWKTKKIFLEPSQPLPDHQLPFTKPMEVDEEYWKKRLLWANRDGIWPSDWGPAPGKKGCLVPEKLLQETNLQPF